jgi:predicted transposase/invertase (TIGR01784 family)
MKEKMTGVIPFLPVNYSITERKEKWRMERNRTKYAEEIDLVQEQIKVNHPHDKGYKRDLSRPEEFLHFLKKYVKADWTQELSVSQLRLCDKEFIDKDYEGREADLIYEITRQNEQQIYLFILQELQSSVDYTMIFRTLVYVFNKLQHFFLSSPKDERERKDFRLPVMIPIVFYNGSEKWTAVKSLQEYQQGGKDFGRYVLNLEYYLVDLAHIEEEYILSSNKVIDNIMYCDKFRNKEQMLDALKQAYNRVEKLNGQEQEEFENWVNTIFLSVCENKEAALKEIVSRLGNGEKGMAIKYNLVKIFEEEKENAQREGREAGHKAGCIAGEERLARLVQILLAEGRKDDLERALSDEAFRQQLYQENNILFN